MGRYRPVETALGVNRMTAYDRLCTDVQLPLSKNAANLATRFTDGSDTSPLMAAVCHVILACPASSPDPNHPEQ